MLRSHPPQVKVAKSRAPLPMLHSHPPQVKVAKLRAPLPMLHSHPPMAARFLFVHLHALFIAQMAAGIIYCSALTLLYSLGRNLEPRTGPWSNFEYIYIYIYMCDICLCVCSRPRLPRPSKGHNTRLCVGWALPPLPWIRPRGDKRRAEDKMGSQF